MPFSWVQTSDVTANDRCGIIVAMAERYADDMPRLVAEAEFASNYGGSAHSVANVVAAGRLFVVTQGEQKPCPDFFLNPAHDGRQLVAGCHMASRGIACRTVRCRQEAG